LKQLEQYPEITIQSYVWVSVSKFCSADSPVTLVSKSCWDFTNLVTHTYRRPGGRMADLGKSFNCYKSWRLLWL